MVASKNRSLRTAWSLGAFALLALGGPPAAVAQREYHFEGGASLTYRSFGSATDLNGSLGVAVRAGYWFYGPLSAELEMVLAHPHSSTTLDTSITVSNLSATLLYNRRIGKNSTWFLRAGLGRVSYGGSCPNVAIVGAPVCGTGGAFMAGAGARLALSPIVMLRPELLVDAGKSTNFGLGVGVTTMIGSRPLIDSDHDGVYDKYDRCPDTPAGALVDKHGCPTDQDGDGVFDGLDRCPGTPKGAIVDEFGCPTDSDADGVFDGIDQCPNTPKGAIVDQTGCTVDTDGDGVPDGLDRCPETPPGATVDALGCPSDSDNDGVPDGLDRCPNTPPGTIVNLYGCPIPAEPSGSPAEPRSDAKPLGMAKCEPYGVPATAAPSPTSLETTADVASACQELTSSPP